MTENRDDAHGSGDPADIFTEMLRIQGEAARQVMESFAPQATGSSPDSASVDAMGEALMKLQSLWLGPEQGGESQRRLPMMADPSQWLTAMQAWYSANPAFDPAATHEIWSDGMELWEAVLKQYGLGATEESKPEPAAFPRTDRRFADPAWRSQPVFALIHQTYLLLAERIAEAVDRVDGVSESEREELRFATKSVLDAMSPANFPMMNPVVLERTLETQGQNLITGMERLQGDIERGQLTHTDTSAFTLGENIAATPGKVVLETSMFQLIHYAPTTDEVLETPLVIFPPWINRFYILDLNPKNSFIRWAVEQGVSVYVVSWRSADESMADVVWDDYIRSQMEAIDFVRDRLKVHAVHTIGYCVAGTTLAATLAILARRGEADKVASATLFTAQVDFERAGDLKLFVDDAKLEMVRQASQGGYLDGRYMAATFNLLRGSDLIWNYVVNHYLLGKDYPAFDLLYWNGDVTNLPAKWHAAYLRDLYRDNRLVEPDELEADGTKIDLTRIRTPLYIQAGVEDHIAPAESVFRLLHHASGPSRFVLAGSGHIAGVVNPPAAGKYQYWTAEEGSFSTLQEFRNKAVETKGSWWPDWIEWLRSWSDKTVSSSGRRNPSARANKAIEDAPGSYVKSR